MATLHAVHTRARVSRLHALEGALAVTSVNPGPVSLVLLCADGRTSTLEMSVQEAEETLARMQRVLERDPRSSLYRGSA